MIAAREIEAMIDAKICSFGQTIDAQFNAKFDAKCNVLQQECDEKLHLLQAKFDILESKYHTLSIKVTSIDEKVDDVSMKFEIMNAKMLNSTMTKHDPLVHVRKADGSMPIEFPQTIGVLIGHNVDTVPRWNAVNSLQLIREYDSGYITDSDDNCDDEDCNRRRRVLVAKHIGVSRYQLNSAQCYGL